MFKKSRRKIVAAIMSILVILWVGTLGVIYAFSYIEMTKQNEQMLKIHAEMYTLSGSFDGTKPPNRPFPGGNPGFDVGFAGADFGSLGKYLAQCAAVKPGAYQLLRSEGRRGNAPLRIPAVLRPGR